MPILPLLKVWLIKTYTLQISISSLFHQALCLLASGHSLYTMDLEAGCCHGYSLPSDAAYVTFYYKYLLLNVHISCGESGQIRIK